MNDYTTSKQLKNPRTDPARATLFWASRSRVRGPLSGYPATSRSHTRRTPSYRLKEARGFIRSPPVSIQTRVAAGPARAYFALGARSRVRGPLSEYPATSRSHTRRTPSYRLKEARGFIRSPQRSAYRPESPPPPVQKLRERGAAESPEEDSPPNLRINCIWPSFHHSPTSRAPGGHSRPRSRTKPVALINGEKKELNGEKKEQNGEQKEQNGE